MHAGQIKRAAQLHCAFPSALNQPQPNGLVADGIGVVTQYDELQNLWTSRATAYETITIKILDDVSPRMSEQGSGLDRVE
jgi:hypothetical protein